MPARWEEWWRCTTTAAIHCTSATCWLTKACSLGLQQCIQLWYTGHPCYGQLTPIKMRYLLTSITTICWLNLRAQWGLVFFHIRHLKQQTSPACRQQPETWHFFRDYTAHVPNVVAWRCPEVENVRTWERGVSCRDENLSTSIPLWRTFVLFSCRTKVNSHNDYLYA